MTLYFTTAPKKLLWVKVRNWLDFLPHSLLSRRSFETEQEIYN